MRVFREEDSNINFSEISSWTYLFGFHWNFRLYGRYTFAIQLSDSIPCIGNSRRYYDVITENGCFFPLRVTKRRFCFYGTRVLNLYENEIPLEQCIGSCAPFVKHNVCIRNYGVFFFFSIANKYAIRSWRVGVARVGFFSPRKCNIILLSFLNRNRTLQP